MPGEYEILRTLLSDRPIAFHPMLARVFGGINEALLFQQLAYWADKGNDPEWIYKTQRDIEDEITLTRTQQENARRRLRGLGVIEEDKRGVPAKLYFRVVWSTVYRLLEETASQDAGNLQPSLLASRAQVRGKAPDLDDVRTQSITKSTQRRQQRGPFEFSKDQTTRQDYDEAREWLLPFVEDFTREMRDTAPITSTLTRLVRIYRQSGLDEDQFTDRMYQARQVTKERVGSVKSGEGGKKRLMPYWFSVLEQLIEDVA
jgi:hypothetical protein